MKIGPSTQVLLLLVLGCFVFAANGSAAEPSAALLKAKKEAEARGFIFETNRDGIVAKAKQEGSVKVLSGLDPSVYSSIMEGFKKKYPFLKIDMLEITGPDSAQRFIMELKSGSRNDFDVAHASTEFYPEYLPFAKKFDLLGMAESGVLRMPPKMVDPKHRALAALGSALSVVAYNKNLIPPDKVPNRWEDFLKPEFKGQKFLADIRPTEIASLVPAWGLEKTVEFARRLGAQQPVWVRGATRIITAITLGEHALFIGPNYHTVKRAQSKDPTGILELKIIEPVPTRLSDAASVLATAQNPYAGLLWLEFLASPKGQKIADDYEPFGASVFIAGFAQEQATRGKKLSVVDWNHFSKMPDYQSKVVEAYGFPKADRK
jgi:ABC-type Fe3+ transport system substrate-binding protein